MYIYIYKYTLLSGYVPVHQQVNDLADFFLGDYNEREKLRWSACLHGKPDLGGGRHDGVQRGRQRLQHEVVVGHAAVHLGWVKHQPIAPGTCATYVA